MKKSQKVLASDVGFSNDSTISKIESGAIAPSQDKLVSLIQILDIDKDTTLDLYEAYGYQQADHQDLSMWENLAVRLKMAVDNAPLEPLTQLNYLFFLHHGLRDYPAVINHCISLALEIAKAKPGGSEIIQAIVKSREYLAQGLYHDNYDALLQSHQYAKQAQAAYADHKQALDDVQTRRKIESHICLVLISSAFKIISKKKITSFKDLQTRQFKDVHKSLARLSQLYPKLVSSSDDELHIQLFGMRESAQILAYELDQQDYLYLWETIKREWSDNQPQSLRELGQILWRQPKPQHKERCHQLIERLLNLDADNARKTAWNNASAFYQRMITSHQQLSSGTLTESMSIPIFNSLSGYAIILARCKENGKAEAFLQGLLLASSLHIKPKMTWHYSSALVMMIKYLTVSEAAEDFSASLEHFYHYAKQDGASPELNPARLSHIFLEPLMLLGFIYEVKYQHPDNKFSPKIKQLIKRIAEVLEAQGESETGKKR